MCLIFFKSNMVSCDFDVMNFLPKSFEIVSYPLLLETVLQ
jgi:hypothetical protein